MTSKLRSCSSLVANNSVRLGVPVIDRISEAVRRGDEDTFRDLISQFKFYESANLNQLDRFGSHPLHRAVMLRRDKMLKTMLHYKNALRLDLDITDANGYTALEIATKNRNHLAVEKLMKHGCKVFNGEVFEELRGQLLGGNNEDYPRSLTQMTRDGLSASCRSVITTQRLRDVCSDGPFNIQSRRHLLHPISGTHWSSDVCEEAVQKCYRDLTSFMDATLIAPLLVTSNHLNLEDVEKILSHSTKRVQAMQLLALLHRAGKFAYQGLFKALKEEKELRAHRELLQQLEETCESIVEAGGEVADAPQEDLEERSLDMSGHTDSGIYSSAYSSGRFSVSSRRTSSSSSLTRSHSGRRSSSSEKPRVIMKGKVNHCACTNFKAVDEHPIRSPLQVIDTVVKREKPVAPVLATEVSQSSNSGAYLVGDHVHLLNNLTVRRTMSILGHCSTQNLDESFEHPASPTESLNITRGEQDMYDIEKDSTEVTTLPSPKMSDPIDIPSRSESFTTSTSVHEADSTSGLCDIPPRRKLSTQISTDTASSNSSDSSYIKLDTPPPAPPPPKDLSRVPSSRPSFLRKIFDRCKTKLTTSWAESEPHSHTSGERDSFYVMGCGMRM